ncbi:MAG: hypothetical protein AB7Q42_06010 [Acidimicrobiia bacterium]
MTRTDALNGLLKLVDKALLAAERRELAALSRGQAWASGCVPLSWHPFP